jgi:hypothetical protein
MAYLTEYGISSPKAWKTAPEKTNGQEKVLKRERKREISPPGKQRDNSRKHDCTISRKKKQVVETTCESHEKTSMSNYCKNRGSCPLENIYFPGTKLFDIKL